MENNVVEKTSFCMVYKDNRTEEWRLYRLFDTEDGMLKKPSIDKSSENRFGNRWSFYRESDSYGTFGVWRWTAKPNSNDNSKDFIKMTQVDNDVIEVIEINGFSSIEELVKKMGREGISRQPVCSRVLFCSGKEGVLCQKGQFKITEGKTYIQGDVIHLPVYTIDISDLLHHEECLDKVFYRKFQLPNPKTTVFVKEPFEIVQDIIKERTSKNSILVTTLKFSRQERQRFQSMIDELPSDDLISDVASKCRCDENRAREYTNAFLSNLKGYISADNYDNEVLDSLVEGHPKLREKYESIVSEKWEKIHQDKISEINQKRAELESLNKQIVSREEKISKLKDDVKLLTDVPDRVKERIEEARKDVASFISEMLLISAFNGSENSSIAQAPILLKGKKIETKEINRDWKDAIGSLEIDLENAGIVEKYNNGFAAFLYSAYVNHVPVLLAGPNARDISDAFSAALFGKTAGVIDCSGPYRPEVVNEIEKSDDEIFTVMNAFRNDWIAHIPELLSSKKYFFIAHPFAEDLLIEPKALFAYAMPVLTELIVDAKPRKFDGAVRTPDFEEYPNETVETQRDLDKTQRDLEKTLKSLGFGALVRSQLQAVFSDFHKMYPENADSDCLFAVFPYAFISGMPQGETLDKLAGKMRISKDLLEELKFFIGVSDE